MLLGTVWLCMPGKALAGSARKLIVEGTTYVVYEVALARDELRLFWKSPDGIPYGGFSALRESLQVAEIELLFATNAGIFIPDGCPMGLHIEDGRRLAALNDTTGCGNFFLKPNGVFFVSGRNARIVRTERWEDGSDITLATQSGPLLVENGRIHPAFKAESQSRYPRNGVGVRPSGAVVFAISGEPVTLYQFAGLFRDRLGCRDALHLDGAISAMYVPELGLTNGGGFVGILAAVRECRRPEDAYRWRRVTKAIRTTTTSARTKRP